MKIRFKTNLKIQINRAPGFKVYPTGSELTFDDKKVPKWVDAEIEAGTIEQLAEPKPVKEVVDENDDTTGGAGSDTVPDGSDSPPDDGADEPNADTSDEPPKKAEKGDEDGKKPSKAKAKSKLVRRNK